MWCKVQYDSLLVSEHYRYNITHMVLFSKTVVRVRLDARIRTILVLTSSKLTWIHFLHLLSVIYFSVTTH
jgi:hypothetical protein